MNVLGLSSNLCQGQNITVIGFTSSAITIFAFITTSSFYLMIFFVLLKCVEAPLFYTPLVAMVSNIAPLELSGILLGGARAMSIILEILADVYGLCARAEDTKRERISWKKGRTL